MKKEEQFGFFTQTENKRILEITSPRKSKKKNKKQKTPQKTENSALAILNDSQAFLYQHVNVSYLTIL